MKKFLAGLGILSLVLALAAPVLAAEAGPITATVTAKKIAVSIDPTSVDYGVLDFTDSQNSGALSPSVTFTATNDGNVNEVFNVRGADATFTGGSWTLVTAISTTDQFRHSVTGTTPAIAEQFLTTSTSGSWSGTIAAAGTQDFTSTFNMPNAGSDGTGLEATTSITVIATE